MRSCEKVWESARRNGKKHVKVTEKEKQREDKVVREQDRNGKESQIEVRKKMQMSKQKANKEGEGK